jgi:uncharacterized tellurite resistance protein B-like protein
MPLWSEGQGSYVECLHCGEAFHPDVLNHPSQMTDRDHAAFRTIMVGIMVSMMDADGVADQRELEAVAMIYGELAGGPVPQSVLRQGIDLARVAGSGGAIQLASNANHKLNQLSRELVFRSALYVSAADGQIQQEEMDFLGDVGKSLGLDEDHMKAIIKSAQDEGHVSIGGRA